MAPKAYSYIRFSTPDQIKGDSLRRQTEFSEKYAIDHGLTMDDSLHLKDLGFSAFRGKHRDRGALGEFLKLVEEGKIEKESVLLVESLDRLSREEIIEALTQFLAIISKGIKIVTLGDNREYTKETVNANFGDLMYSLTIMSRAHEESAMKSMRLSKAWEEKRNQIGSRKLTARCPAWLELSKDKAKFVPIADRKKLIENIFLMKLAGKGATAIVKELNQNKAVSWKPGSKDKRKQGEGWRESYVKKILKSRAVIGEFQPNKLVNKKRQPIGGPILDYFPAVIEKGIFFRVQEQLKQNKHKGGQTGTINNIFSHIAKCGLCKGSMAFVDKGPPPKGGKYLVCDRARRGLNCSNSSVRYNEFERLILTHCNGLRPQDILGKSDEITGKISVAQDEYDSIVAELNSTEAEINNIAGSIASTPDHRVRELLEKQMSDRFDRKTSLEQKVDYIMNEIKTLSNVYETTQQSLDTLGDLLAFLKKSNNDDKMISVRLRLRGELRKLIKSIYIYPKDISAFVARQRKSLRALQDAFPKGLLEHWVPLKEYMEQKIEHPDVHRPVIIQFISGSERYVFPQDDWRLTTDYDTETRSLHSWAKTSEDTIVRTEIFYEGTKKTYFKPSIGPDGEEVLSEISNSFEISPFYVHNQLKVNIK